MNQGGIVCWDKTSADWKKIRWKDSFDTLTSRFRNIQMCVIAAWNQSLLPAEIYQLIIDMIEVWRHTQEYFPFPTVPTITVGRTVQSSRPSAGCWTIATCIAREEAYMTWNSQRSLDFCPALVQNLKFPVRVYLFTRLTFYAVVSIVIVWNRTEPGWTQEHPQAAGNRLSYSQRELN